MARTRKLRKPQKIRKRNKGGAESRRGSNTEHLKRKPANISVNREVLQEKRHGVTTSEHDKGIKLDLKVYVDLVDRVTPIQPLLLELQDFCHKLSISRLSAYTVTNVHVNHYQKNANHLLGRYRTIDGIMTRIHECVSLAATFLERARKLQFINSSNRQKQDAELLTLARRAVKVLSEFSSSLQHVIKEVNDFIEESKEIVETDNFGLHKLSVSNTAQDTPHVIGRLHDVTGHTNELLQDLIQYIQENHVLQDLLRASTKESLGETYNSSDKYNPRKKR